MRLLTRDTTDREGKCRIAFPQVLPRRAYITARKAGYAVRAYSPLQETGGRALPRAHTMELEHGVTIGGIVKRRDGRPIPGATVTIMARAGADASPDYSYVDYENVTTDASGHWIFGAMPLGWSFVSVSVSHPDYVATFMQRDTPRLSDFDLKARKAQIILDEGVALSGRVLDDQGRPIAGATVGLGADRRIGNRGWPSVTTDADGGFRFGHVPAGTQTVTAMAPGRARSWPMWLPRRTGSPWSFDSGPAIPCAGASSTVTASR